MNNKVKKREHKRTDKRGHRYDRLQCIYKCVGRAICYHPDICVCKCGKVRPLNNKGEGR